MNPHEPNARPVTDERLSAYFDGEASPAERAAVESLLDDSLAARRELDEISQLSALLHSFPRESAPTELAANVQRQTDQMPLAVQAVAPAVPARSLRREWTAAISGALVTAAALFVMASVVDPTGSRGLKTVAQNGSPASGLAAERTLHERIRFMTPAAAGRAETVSRDSSGGIGTPRYADRVTDGTVASPLAMGAAPKMSGPVAGKAPAGDAAYDAPAVANASPEGLFEAQQNRALGVNLMLADNGAVQNFSVNNPDFLNGLKVGEIYQFVPQVADNGNNVAVVDLQVLDVERGVDQVQVLLSKNSIQPRLAGQTNSFEKQKSPIPRDQSKSNSGEIVVVYSVGPGEQLAKTLEDMSRHPDLFVGWSSQAPVQLPTGDELAVLKEDAASAKDGKAPADKSTADKSNATKLSEERQLAMRRKEGVWADDDMGDEAELALNALLVRNTYTNNNYGNLNSNGIANFNDSNSNTANFGIRAVQQGVPGDAKPFSRAGAPEPPAPAPAGTPLTASTQPAKALSNNPKNAPPSAEGPRTVADEKGKGELAAKKSGEQKQDADARRELERRSYQTTFRVPTDAVPFAELQTQPLNRSNTSNTSNYDNGASRVRRSSNSATLQQAETLNRAAANTQAEANRVKVLFVLHPMPAPAAAAAPASKQNP